MVVTASAYEVIELALSSLDFESSSSGKPSLLFEAARWPAESPPVEALLCGLHTLVESQCASDEHYQMFASSLRLAERCANGCTRHAIRVSDLFFGAYNACAPRVNVMTKAGASLGDLVENRMEQQELAETQRDASAGRRTVGILFGVAAHYRDGSSDIENKFMRFDHAMLAKEAFERDAGLRSVEETRKEQHEYFFIFPPPGIKDVKHFSFFAILDE